MSRYVRYNRNTTIRTAPSQRSTLYFDQENTSSNIILTSIMLKSNNVTSLICIGQITEVQPIIHKILNTLLPSTFPIAIPALPLRAATTVVASSGSDVPKATIVNPITLSLTFNCCAMPTAASTKMSEPQISRASPKTIRTFCYGLLRGAILWLICCISFLIFGFLYGVSHKADK